MMSTEHDPIQISPADQAAIDTLVESGFNT